MATPRSITLFANVVTFPPMVAWLVLTGVMQPSPGGDELVFWLASAAILAAHSTWTCLVRPSSFVQRLLYALFTTAVLAAVGYAFLWTQYDPTPIRIAVGIIFCTTLWNFIDTLILQADD